MFISLIESFHNLYSDLNLEHKKKMNNCVEITGISKDRIHRKIQHGRENYSPGTRKDI